MSFQKNKNLAPVVIRVQYAFAYEVNSISNGLDDNHKVVNFKPGTTWKDLYSSPNAMQYEEPAKTSEAGKLQEQKLTCFYPGDDTNNISDFDNIENRPLIVRFHYNNNTSRFIGSKDNPAEVNLSYSSQRGGTVITFTCASRNRAFWL